MDHSGMQLIDSSDNSLIFNLLTEQTLEEMKNVSQLRAKMNEEIRIPKHNCQYLWKNDPSSPNGFLRILIITWNLQGTFPQQSLKNLFHTNDITHQLIVIATQECQRSICLSLFCESKQAWEQKIQNELGKSYQKVHAITMNALSLIIFAHKQIPSAYQLLKSFSLPLGFLNLVGNKGAIGIAIKVGIKSFLFVCNHLQSGQQDNFKRKQQFSTISSKILISNNQQREVKVDLIIFNSYKITDQFDYVFFMGDFNSRINQSIDQTQMKNLDFFQCLQNDQKLQSGFASEFNEGMILFPPTYKLSTKQNQWCVGKDYRIPGWTDRIIFKMNKHSQIKQLEQQQFQILKKKSQIVNITEEVLDTENVLQLHNYDANFEVFGSDHRPVFAQFQVQL